MTLTEINEQAGTSFRRWDDLVDFLRRDGPHEIRLSDWQQDYSYEGIAMAVKAGYIVPQAPEGWIAVRDVAMKMGGTDCVPWMLASSNRPAEIVQQSGIFDRCRLDLYYELLCSPEDAEILIAHATPMWERYSA